MEKYLDEILDGLRQIERGEGPYNRDPFEHAKNVIESQIDLAKRLLIVALEAKHSLQEPRQGAPS